MKKRQFKFWGFALALVISFAFLSYLDLKQYEIAPLEQYEIDRGIVG